jgi:SM-20-related protein
LSEGIAEELAGRGWSVREGFLDADEAHVLAEECRMLRASGEFRHARVGIGAGKQLRPEVRTDRVLWLAEGSTTAAQHRCLQRLEELRVAINRRTYLGLFGFEAHLALYPPGSYYRRHLDRFRGAGHRVVTAVIYLNEDWQVDYGGCLRLYFDDGDEPRCHDIVPTAGTLVTFLSGTFEHEVLPATRDRLSLTGWFCTR